MITLETLHRWLNTPAETERLEFKEAKQQYDSKDLMQYCAALANEGGGHLVLGVTDKRPRNVVGSNAYASADNLNSIKLRVVQELGLSIESTELQHPDGRVLVFTVPARGIGQAISYKGVHWMRSGESTIPMTPDKLRAIFAEGQPDWLSQLAKTNASPDEVIGLLDTQAYFDLLKIPYPTNREAVLERLAGEGLISRSDAGWAITNLAAIMLAKKLDAFSPALARKAPRFVIYEGIDKLQTREDVTGSKGYAPAFEGLVDFVHAAAPRNHIIEQTVRQDVKMFPRQALRELLANALVHQDFAATGSSVMIEMYDDRIEISNAGVPPINVERFIDEYRSRNERLADLMRRFGICEEKGSGIDKVVKAAEVYQLPAPDFRVGDIRTTAVMFAHQEFAKMSKADRIRACYQHCCLLYVSNQRMSNQSLRERFGFPENTSTAIVSQVIAAAIEAGRIKVDDSESTSKRYARYLPYWA